jgi:hypothetical protein
MRFYVALAILGVALVPAVAQAQADVPIRTLRAIERDFPRDHRAIEPVPAGKRPEEARQTAYAAIDAFLRQHRDAILAAPGSALVAIEGRIAALLRTFERNDVGLCATLGDRGLFSSEALAVAAPPGLDDFGVALVEAAKAGGNTSLGSQGATKEDFLGWLSAAEGIEPDVPIRAVLVDPELRKRSRPDQLCRGAAAMHEAVARLPPGQRERIARTLLGSVIGSAKP